MMKSGIDYICRVKVAFNNLRVGQVIDPSSLYRDKLLRGGFVEMVPAVPVEEPKAQSRLKPRE